VKFAAVYNHQSVSPKLVKNPDEISLSSSDEDEQDKVASDRGEASDQVPIITKFLALDKCLPKRQFLEIIQVEETNSDYEIKLDAEWLSIIKATTEYMPFSKQGTIANLPTEVEMNQAIHKSRQWVNGLGESILRPPNFCKTADALTDNESGGTGNQGIFPSSLEYH